MLPGYEGCQGLGFGFVIPSYLLDNGPALPWANMRLLPCSGVALYLIRLIKLILTHEYLNYQTKIGHLAKPQNWAKFTLHL